MCQASKQAKPSLQASSFTLAKGCLACLCFSSPPVLFIWSLCSYVYNNFFSSTGRVMDKIIPYSLVAICCLFIAELFTLSSSTTLTSPPATFIETMWTVFASLVTSSCLRSVTFITAEQSSSVMKKGKTHKKHLSEILIKRQREQSGCG